MFSCHSENAEIVFGLSLGLLLQSIVSLKDIRKLVKERHGKERQEQFPLSSAGLYSSISSS